MLYFMKINSMFLKFWNNVDIIHKYFTNRLQQNVNIHSPMISLFYFWFYEKNTVTPIRLNVIYKYVCSKRFSL